MDAKTIVRQQYRVDLAENSSIALAVAGQPHRVCDLSEGGVSFHLAPEDIFYLVGEHIDAVLIIDRKNYDISGTITHITPSISGECGLCGVRFNQTETSAQTMKAVSDFLAEQRKSLFQQ